MFIKAKGPPSALVSISTFFGMPFGAHFVFAIGFLTVFFGVIVFAIPFISAVSRVIKCAHHLLLCSHHFATSHFVWNSFTFSEHSFCDHFLGGPELNWTGMKLMYITLVKTSHFRRSSPFIIENSLFKLRHFVHLSVQKNICEEFFVQSTKIEQVK